MNLGDKVNLKNQTDKSDVLVIYSVLGNYKYHLMRLSTLNLISGEFHYDELEYHDVDDEEDEEDDE